MHHRPIRPLLLAAALLTAAPQGTAVAAGPTSGTIGLKGSVSSRCTIDVEDSNATLNLVAGSTRVQVATVTESCNNIWGYTVTFSSRNSGAMQTSNGDRIAYKMSYDDASNASLSSPLTLSRTFLESLFSDTHTLHVTVPPTAQAKAGSYSDTITVTIAAR